MTFLDSTLGVASSGPRGSVGGFTFFQSRDPNIVLYVAERPTIARGNDGRLQVAVTQYRQQVDATAGDVSGDTYKITGGSLAMTVAPQPRLTPQALAEATEVWRAQLPLQDARFPANPTFIPLNCQQAHAKLLIDQTAGIPSADNERDVGTPGAGNITFLANLTAAGTEAFVQGIEQKTQVPAGVQITYQYPRYMLPTGAEVIMHGDRVFQHLSGDLSASYNGIYYGGSAKVSALFEEMRKTGAIEINLIGTPEGADQQLRDDLVTTFTKEAQSMLFDTIFKPAPPTVEAAKAGNSGGIFGGVNFALKWQKAEEAIDMNFTIKFEGWTWLTAVMDADCTTMFHELDASYVTKVDTEQQTVAVLTASGEDKIRTMACTWAASEGKAPATAVFDSEGGVNSYIVTAKTPNDVTVTSTAKLVFDEPKFPVIKLRQESTIANGGGAIVWKPDQYLARHYLYLYVVDSAGKVNWDVDERSHLVVSVTYKFKDTLTDPDKPKTRVLRASAKITPEGPLQFVYPWDPVSEITGEATISAFGVIGNKVVRSKTLPLDMTNEAALVLASPKAITLATDGALPEADRDGTGDLARRLLQGGMRPRVSGAAGEVAERLHTAETLRRQVREQRRGSEAGKRDVFPPTAARSFQGRIAAREFTAAGDYLWVEHDGDRRRFELPSWLPDDTLTHLSTGSAVEVRLGESGDVAQTIVLS